MNSHTQKSESPEASGADAKQGAFSVNIVANQSDKCKQKTIATLTAQLALKGYEVHEGSSEDFLVTRWNLSRYCQDLAALIAFADEVGA